MKQHGPHAMHASHRCAVTLHVSLRYQYQDLRFCFTPLQADIELPIPHYFTSENFKVLKERDKLLGTILAHMGPKDASEVHHGPAFKSTCSNLATKPACKCTAEILLLLHQCTRTYNYDLTAPSPPVQG